jgi:hypothetical protein
VCLTPLAALAGGAFLGFSSCGGHVWHAYAIGGFIVFLVAVSFIFPHWDKPVFSRVVFSLLTLMIFLFARSSGAQFYPNAPLSLSAFLLGVWRDLWAGVC